MQVKREKIFTYLTFTMKKCAKKKKTLGKGEISTLKDCVGYYWKNSRKICTFS